MNEENVTRRPYTLEGKLRMTQEKLNKEWGRGQKRTSREQQSLLFANRFLRVGGTFLFTQEHRDFGYENIWQAFAGELHDAVARPMEKAANANEYAGLYQQGFYALNEKLLTEWNNAMIYAVPTRPNGALIEVLTMDPDLVFDGSENTVHEIWEQRELGRATGQIKASTRKLTRTVGKVKAQEQLHGILNTFADSLQIEDGKRESDLA